MFLGQMGLRRVWYRALCGMCDRKRYWNTYMKTLSRVDADMNKQMDIVTLIRRLRAHGFALSMMFEKETLKSISKKSKGKPFEMDEVEEEVSSDNNLWGAQEMFSRAEKGKIAEQEEEFGTVDKDEEGGSMFSNLIRKVAKKKADGPNERAMRQLDAVKQS